MPANADETKMQLLLAAEELFAARGIDAVSLREINKHAGQKNTSAVRYHFGNIEAVIDAILIKRMVVLETLRKRALENLSQDASLEELITVSLMPLVDKVCGTARQAPDPAWGNYVQVLTQLTSTKGAAYVPLWKGKYNKVTEIVYERFRVHLPDLDEKLFRQRQADLLRYTLTSLGDRALKLRLKKRPLLTRQAFVDNLCLVSAAILRA